MRLRRSPPNFVLGELSLLQQPVPGGHRGPRGHRPLTPESGDYGALLRGLGPQSGEESQPHPGKLHDTSVIYAFAFWVDSSLVSYTYTLKVIISTQ